METFLSLIMGDQHVWKHARKRISAAVWATCSILCRCGDGPRKCGFNIKKSHCDSNYFLTFDL